jgi:hypothetical protein
MLASVFEVSDRVLRQVRACVGSAHPILSCRHVGDVGRERKHVGSVRVGFDPVIRGPLRPDAMVRTHG